MQTDQIYVCSSKRPPIFKKLQIYFVTLTHSHQSTDRHKPGPGSGELWSLMVWNKYVFIRCIISAPGLGFVFITQHTALLLFVCSLHCLQWILLYLFFLSMKLAFLLSQGITFSFISENLGEFLSRLRAGWWCWCVHVQSKIIDQSSPGVICIHTTLDGNKIKFFICAPTTHTHAIIDPRSADLNVLIICVTAMEWVCEHYGLYGGCHVTSPLDYYHRKEMTLSRQEADPQYNYIYTTRRRSPDSKESRTQLVQTSDVRQKIQNNREHLCWSAVVTPISGNGDIKWCCDTNNGSRPPDTGRPWSLLFPATKEAKQTVGLCHNEF